MIRMPGIVGAVIPNYLFSFFNRLSNFAIKI
jgi:hypothetical protein